MKPFILQLRHLLTVKAACKGRGAGAVLFFTVLLTPQTYAAEKQYDALYVMSSQTSVHMRFKEAIESQQSESTIRHNKRRFVAIDKLQTTELKKLVNNSRVVVTLGQNSMRDVVALQVDTPHIATLITLEDFRENLSRRPPSQGRHCALVIDQPLSRITRIIRDRLPDTRIAGIIETAEDKNIVNSGELTRQKNDPHIIRVSLNKNIHSTIESLSQSDVDAIIALHNKDVYNRSTARNILISSYHFNIPLIGYSSAFVKAGALIGIYSNPDAMASDTLDIIKNIEKCYDGNILHPSSYTVEVNPQVAKSLEINIDTSEPKQTYQDRPSK